MVEGEIARAQRQRQRSRDEETWRNETATSGRTKGIETREAAQNKVYTCTCVLVTEEEGMSTGWRQVRPEPWTAFINYNLRTEGLRKIIIEEIKNAT